MRKKLFKLLVLVSASTPLVLLASTQPVYLKPPTRTVLFCALDPNPLFQDLMGYATCIISRSVIPLIFALAAASFVWGVVQYVINNDEEAKKEKGKQFMIWGIIGLTVMVSVWGLVKVLGSTFGIQNVIPQTQTNNTGAYDSPCSDTNPDPNDQC